MPSHFPSPPGLPGGFSIPSEGSLKPAKRVDLGTMKFYMNRTGSPVLLPVSGSSTTPLHVPPMGVVTSRQYGGLFRPLVEIPNVRNFLSESGDGSSFVLHIHRSYAAGDVMMLVPLLRRILQEYPAMRIDVSSSWKYEEFLSRVDRRVVYRKDAWMKSRQPRWDLSVNLDGVLEADHGGGYESGVHRVNLYLEVFGIPPLTREDDLAALWCFTPTPEAQRQVSSLVPRGSVAVQWRGSHSCKTLAPAIMGAIVRRVALDFPVVVFDQSRMQVSGFDSGANSVQSSYSITSRISVLSGTAGLPAAIAAIAGCSAVITMDSGVLWMAHLSLVPVVCLLGPTRASERVSLHPSRAEGIQMEESIGCSPCFEKAEACGRTYPCMRPDADWLVEEVMRRLRVVLG